jgi:tetratricopeptide (TPR) repeat protein
LQQRFELAIEMAGVARDKAPSNSSVIQFAMRVFDTAGDTEELIICYQLLLKINPDNDVLRHRFAVFLADQFSDQAIEQLLVLHQAHPGNASYLFHLSLLYINTRQFDDARTALTRLRGFAYYEDEANYYLGWMALDQGDGDQAERYLLRVQSPHLLIQRYQALLDVYLLQRKFNQAVQQTYLLEPLLYNDSAAVNYLSQSSLLTALGDFDAALLALEKVEAINDQLSQIYYRRAMIFRQQGKLSQSEQIMKYFITLEPNDAASMHILGRWLAEDDRQYRQAVVWLERASEVDSESAAILDDLGWLLLKLNRIAEAKSYLAKAQELVEDAQVAAHFAEVLWRSGDQSRAKELLKEAFTQSPRDKVLAETIRRLDVVLD